MIGKNVLETMLVCAGLAALLGCSTQERVECSCATGILQVTSPEPVAEIATSGPACASQPICERSLDGGRCDIFEIFFTAGGTCHVAATAADGRHASFDETVTVTPGDSCCANIFRGSAAQITLAFPPADAGAP